MGDWGYKTIGKGKTQIRFQGGLGGSQKENFKNLRR